MKMKSLIIIAFLLLGLTTGKGRCRDKLKIVEDENQALKNELAELQNKHHDEIAELEKEILRIEEKYGENKVRKRD